MCGGTQDDQKTIDVDKDDLVVQQNQKSNRKKLDMSRTNCFIIIVKYYYLLHEDVTASDVAKLQLLNKRCYNQLIPMAMDQFRILPEPRPCSLSYLEPDIQETIEGKRSQGVKLKSGHVLTV